MRILKTLPPFRLAPLLLIIFVLLDSTAFSQKKIIPSAQEVADYIVDKDIKHPEIVLRQAIMESGWFKCDIATKKNNLFGFRSNGAYFTFGHWKESIDYYKKWQEKNYKNEREDYYQFLKRIKYATSKNYRSKLEKINLRNIRFDS